MVFKVGTFQLKSLVTFQPKNTSNVNNYYAPGAAIYFEQGPTEIPIVITNNTIYDNFQAPLDLNGAISIVDGGWPIEICNNLIYNNNLSGVATNFDVTNLNPNLYDYYFTFENNTIMNNGEDGGDGLVIDNVRAMILTNNVLVGNDGYGIQRESGQLLSVEYSIIHGNSGGHWNSPPNESTNVLHENPKIDTSNGYQPLWSATDFSPCIDAGDPETEWDADDTPPDIGAVTAITHAYFNDQYDGGVYNRIDWISYPVMNRITDEYTEALGLLDRQGLITLPGSLDDILEFIWLEGDIVIEFDEGAWQNNLGNFDSQQGYKVELQDDYDDVSFKGISGQAMNVSEPIQLYAGQANWIGCYLEEPATIEDAFESIFDEWTSISSEHWKINRVPPDTIPMTRWTVNPGELYIIRVAHDCELVWGSSGGGVETYTKEMTDYFDYEEELDYMAINVDTVYGDTTVTEIAVFDGEECLGASKVEDGYPVQILAYTPEGGLRGDGLQFQLYSGSRNTSKSVTNYTVYDQETSVYVSKPVYYERDGYVNVKLNTEQAPEPEIAFTLLNNYPNPVNTGVTQISFAPVKDAENTEIRIYNLKGQLVKKLDCDNTTFNNGLFTVTWDCSDNYGRKVASGIYFYKLVSDKKIAIKKMVIIR